MNAFLTNPEITFRRALRPTFCGGVPKPVLLPTFLAGMNAFLKNLEITFRRDPTNYRPRINKKESTKDREQKLAGEGRCVTEGVQGLTGREV